MTGFFRPLPVNEFKNEVMMGYCIEILLQFFPLFICQIFNNLQVDFEKFSVVQSLALGIKVIYIMVFVLEVLIRISEIRIFKHKLKLGYQKTPEPVRRRKWSNPVKLWSAFSLFIFLAALIGGIILEKPRFCGESQIMELAVCKDCPSYC